MSLADPAVTAALIAAMAVVAVGLLQYLALAHQNKIATFAKRTAVFRAAYDALDRAFKRPEEREEAIKEFRSAFQDSWFLFPPRLSDDLEKMLNNLIDTTAGDHSIDGPDSESQQTKREALKNLIQHRDGLRKIFQPHLRI